MDWQSAWEGLPTVIISTAVIAAAIAAIFNLIINLINNNRLKSIEKSKKMTEIQKYRYTNLYELVKGWNEHSTKVNGDTPGQIAANRLINMPLDNIGRYDIARPLLNPIYVDDFDKMVANVNSLLHKLIDLETVNGKHLDGFDEARKEYFDYGSKFGDALKKTIYDQLKELLLHDENTLHDR
ncbi:MAG: hypothetical protein FWE90_08665 [Defluviitaleaceae bacterium]|nr:hypothetical protein [Defluviitaleaceae bacterium]